MSVAPVYIAELVTVLAEGKGASARAQLALVGIPQAALAVFSVTNQETGERADGLYSLKGIACCASEALEFAEGYAMTSPDAVLTARADWPYPTDAIPHERAKTPLGEFIVFPTVDMAEDASTN